MAERDSGIQSRILLKLEADLKLTLLAVAEECERIMILKHDTDKIEERDVFGVQGVHQKLKEDKEKNHINALVGVVCISRSVVHSGIKSVSGVKIGPRQTHCKTKKENLQNPAKVMLTKKDRNQTLNRKFVDAKLNNKSIRIQLDTGSNISIIDKKHGKL